MALDKRSITLATMVALVAASSLLNLVEGGNCNFAASCTNERLNGTILSARCMQRFGKTSLTSINLDQNIGNSNGRLVYNAGGGDYSASCSNASLSGDHILVASCRIAYGDLVETSIDLNNCITNFDGFLMWC